MTAIPWSVGLITGTVLDGVIDVALLRTDGHEVVEFGPWAFVAYEPRVQALIEDAVNAARHWGFDGPEPAAFAMAEHALTDAQADAVRDVLARQGIDQGAVATVGFHGQTVLHRAPSANAPGRTRQLGDGARMAARLGIDVVSEWRMRDVQRGGQGAPLAPVYHRALLSHIDAPPGTVFLNLGGVANLTCVVDDEMIAFDTGPANAPIDDWLRRHTGAAMDRDGRQAAAGTVDEERLAGWLDDPWFAAPWPKSLDRHDFAADRVDGLSVADGAATLTAFAAGAVARALEHLPIDVTGLLVGGGGRHNPSLMKELGKRTGVGVRDCDEAGLRGDAIEAECFAFLAARSRQSLPISFPGTTGVAEPTHGGTLYPANVVRED